MNVILQVEGMRCGGGASSVQRALGALAHVSGVDVDLASGRVTVHCDADLPRDALVSAVTAAGFDVRDV